MKQPLGSGSKKSTAGSGNNWQAALMTPAGLGLIGTSVLVVLLVVLDFAVFRTATPTPPADRMGGRAGADVSDDEGFVTPGPIWRDGPIPDEARDHFRYTAFDTHGPTREGGGGSGSFGGRGDSDAAELFQIADLKWSEPMVLIPRGQGGSAGGSASADGQALPAGASASVKITGTLRNLSGRDCRRLTLKAYCFDAYGQIVGQGGKSLTDDPMLKSSATTATPFEFEVIGMPADVQIDRITVVPENVYWALDD